MDGLQLNEKTTVGEQIEFQLTSPESLSALAEFGCMLLVSSWNKLLCAPWLSWQPRKMRSKNLSRLRRRRRNRAINSSFPSAIPGCSCGLSSPESDLVQSQVTRG